MLYLIGHDKETGEPKTRWSIGFNYYNQDMLDTIKVFCECIDDISDIYIHDDTGKFIKLSDVCDYYKIPYTTEDNHDRHN